MKPRLPDIHPELMNEWMDDTDPSDHSPRSNYRARWRCPSNHEYTMEIKSRTAVGTTCPTCKRIPAMRPDLIEYWNDDRDIGDFRPHSRYVANWKCQEGHEWKQAISYFAEITNCRFCKSEEEKIPASFADEWADPSSPDKYTKRSSYRPLWRCPNGHEYRVGIRRRVFDGAGCKECLTIPTTNPELLEFWADSRPPNKFKSFNDISIDWACSQGHTWRRRLKKFAANPVCHECNGQKYKPKMSSSAISLAEHNPSLAEEYIDEYPPADQIGYSSSYKALWRCPIGHEYRMEVNSRTSHGIVCQDCKRIPHVRPDMVGYWNDSRDIGEFKPGSGYVAKWKCRHGHEWSIAIKEFAQRTRCKMCSMSKIDQDIATEWDDPRDISLFSSGSPQKVRWQCINGHTYYCSVQSRTAGVGCQACKSIAFLKPDLLKYWNDERDPETVTVKSLLDIDWKCAAGHEWSQRAESFTRIGSCPICSNRRIIPGINDVLTTHGPFENVVNPEVLTRCSAGSETILIRRCPKHGEYSQMMKEVTGRGFGCPKCNAPRSRGEIEVFDFIGEGIPNDRSLGKELDIFIPDKNIAIEYNGLYWHTEKRVGRSYHADKYTLCRENGVQLIQIWEDDWLYNQDVVKKMLDAKINGRPTIGARKTTLKQIDFHTAADFLSAWHIQGSAKGSAYIGLYTDELVAVGVFKTVQGVTYLERYASSIGVQGGLEKMIKHLSPAKLVTFADLTVSDGGLYSGWEFDGFLKPDYKYLYKGKREHKFNFRLKRFKNDPELLFDPALSESKLAELNDVPRIYDAGKARYIHK